MHYLHFRSSNKNRRHFVSPVETQLDLAKGGGGGAVAGCCLPMFEQTREPNGPVNAHLIPEPRIRTKHTNPK